MLHGKAAAAPAGHAGIHVHDIAKRGGYMEVATGLNQRYSGNIVAPEHFRFLDAERAVKERIGAGIKVFEVAREKDNPKGIAIAPFNVDFFSVGKHCD